MYRWKLEWEANEVYEQNVSSNLVGTSSNYGVPKTETDVPRISNAMGAVQKLIAENRELATIMEQRLNAVLRPSGPEAANGGVTEPRSTPSPLVNDLEGFISSLETLARHYNDILNRLEV